MKGLKLAIVDDHKMVRDTFAYYMEDRYEMQVVINADNGKQFLNKLKTTKVDVVLLDIRMPVMNGQETCKVMAAKYPEVKIIALTFYNEKDRMTEMLSMGASGFVCKEYGVTEAVNAIKAVMCGQIYVSKKLKTAQAITHAKLPENSDNTYGITVREIKVLHLLNEGDDGKTIADKLFISYRTVDSHKRNLFRKTGANSVLKLLAFCRQNGIVE